MQFVEQLPDDILEELSSFSDWFFSQDLSKVLMERPQGLTLEKATSTEYLIQRQNETCAQKQGFPEQSYGVDFLNMDCFDTDIFMGRINQLDGILKTYVGAQRAALKMYYPPEGFIDWHNNSNAFGYNILFTYSETGDGAFLYQHPITKEIVQMTDKKGWSAKVGCYDRADGQPLWHAAYTRCRRLNWAYVVPETLWYDLVEELGVDPKFLDGLFGAPPELLTAQREIFNRSILQSI